MKTNKTTRFIAEMGIFIALGLVFDFLSNIISGVLWPNGGSISIAMIPIFLMSYRHGIKGGLISGIAIGTIQMLWAGSGIVHWAQALLDYTLAYGIVGVAGLFAKKIKDSSLKLRLIYVNVSVLIAGLLRTALHVISGFVYFKEYLPQYSPEATNLILWLGSCIYNITYMLPSIILCMILMSIITFKYLDFFIFEKNKN